MRESTLVMTGTGYDAGSSDRKSGLSVCLSSEQSGDTTTKDGMSYASVILLQNPPPHKLYI